jgi:hypothetical protein
MDKTLNTFTIRELRKEVSKTNIKNYSKLRKADLIKLMIKEKETFNHLFDTNKSPPKRVIIKIKKKKDISEKEKKLLDKINSYDVVLEKQVEVTEKNTSNRTSNKEFEIYINKLEELTNENILKAIKKEGSIVNFNKKYKIKDYGSFVPSKI